MLNPCSPFWWNGAEICSEILGGLCALCYVSIRCLGSAGNIEIVLCYNKAINYHLVFQCGYKVLW